MQLIIMDYSSCCELACSPSKTEEDMDYFSCCEFACSQCEDCEEDIADDIPTSPIAQFDQAASPVRPKYTDQLSYTPIGTLHSAVVAVNLLRTSVDPPRSLALSSIQSEGSKFEIQRGRAPCGHRLVILSGVLACGYSERATHARPLPETR